MDPRSGTGQSPLIDFLFCAWSSIAIFVWLIRTKYKWKTPPYGVFAVYGAVGVLAGVGAGLVNLFIGRETEFWFFSQDRFYSLMGFILGAGLGEEFWKFACGMVITVCLLGMNRDTGSPGRVLSFVVLGLSFATFENWVAYSGGGYWLLVSRGLSAVPLHGVMGMIHGLAVDAAVRRRQAWPLVAGYLIAAALHTTYNVSPMFVPEQYHRYSMFPIVFVLVSWAVVSWRRLPEFGANEVVPPLRGEFSN